MRDTSAPGLNASHTRTHILSEGITVQVEGGTRVHVNNGTLRIDSLRREDGGEYECRAENEAGVMTSSALLQVYGEWGVQGGILPGNNTHTYSQLVFMVVSTCEHKHSSRNSWGN